MARPLKSGLDYFPHDTDSLSDEKIEVMTSLYGNDGYAFYFILLERIYRTPSAELCISASETRQILCRKLLITELQFENMLNTALKIGLFDQKIYNESRVLTSAGIKNRAKVVLDKREKMREKYEQYEKRKIVSDAETPVSSPISDAETLQKPDKVKESKEKESKVKNIYAERFEEIWSKYPNKDGKKLSQGHFNVSVKTEQDWLDINKALNNYLQSRRVKSGYVKNGSTWFNNWKDWVNFKEEEKNEKSRSYHPKPAAGKYDDFGN